MASVVSERHGGRTRYRIQFRDGNKRRRSIRLSGLTRKAADAICSRVETLNACKISGQPLDTATSRWLAELGEELYDKLASAGLAEPRHRAAIGAFVDQYIDGRTDIEERTRKNWRSSARILKRYFGEGRELRSITPGDADDFRRHLVETYDREATVAAHIKRVKHFFRYAHRKRLLEANPFDDVKGGRMHNSDRQAFIGRDIIDEVLEQCPDAQWRLIIALCRYGGLRCPSEVLNLGWQDIDWDEQRFTVTSPKTRKQGKAYRVVPLFPRA